MLEGVTSIGNYAFFSIDSLSTVTIPDSVTSIGDYAFYSQYVSTVTMLAINPPTFGDNAFDTLNGISIYVPAGSVEAYKTAAQGKDFSNYIYANPNS